MRMGIDDHRYPSFLFHMIIPSYGCVNKKQDSPETVLLTYNTITKDRQTAGYFRHMPEAFHPGFF